jgi:hypothetical protein
MFMDNGTIILNKGQKTKNLKLDLAMMQKIK